MLIMIAFVLSFYFKVNVVILILSALLLAVVLAVAGRRKEALR